MLFLPTRFPEEPIFYLYFERSLMAHAGILQPNLFDGCPVQEAVDQLAHASCANERGAIFTKREVVDFMLDLSSYQPGKNLAEITLLEPSFGGGDFLLPAISRLLTSYTNRTVIEPIVNSIRAVEVHKISFDSTKSKVIRLISDAGFSELHVQRLADTWLMHGDFLLTRLENSFDVVIGNPPYVRQELLPEALLQEYRRQYSTLYDRADLYIPFIERSLSLLNAKGELCFICADRWMKNKYGTPLRGFISKFARKCA